MERCRILLADDDPQIREVVRLLLEAEGFEIVEAVDGEDVLAKGDESFDLFILDVMMPGRSGYAACTELRKRTTAPVLFLTAKSRDEDKTAGFSAGGDDYLVKPFSAEELTARVRAMLRRYYVYRGKEAPEETGVIRLLDLDIWTDRNQVCRGETAISLTDLEYRILLMLAQNRRQTFTSQQIYEEVWKQPFLFSSNNTVTVHIRNLRRKLEDDVQSYKYIKSIWGKGYCVE